MGGNFWINNGWQFLFSTLQHCLLVLHAKRQAKVLRILIFKILEVFEHVFLKFFSLFHNLILQMFLQFKLMLKLWILLLFYKLQLLYTAFLHWILIKFLDLLQLLLLQMERLHCFIQKIPFLFQFLLQSIRNELLAFLLWVIMRPKLSLFIASNSRL